jgi:hypothetical protein
MNPISISQAWAYATSFFSDQHQNHAILLIGVGVLGPLLLNLATGGAAAGAMVTPDQLASGAAIGAIGGMAILAGLIGYILQSGSYFASWRMGLEPGKESIGSAVGYGLVAALPVMLVSIGFIIVIGIVAGIVFGAALFPILLGRGSDGAALGSLGGMLLALPLALVAMLWLAARFCCMGPVMAANRSFNPLLGLAESWRMTGAAQWKLMGYFVLIFIVVLILSMIFGMVAGVSMLVGGGAGGLTTFALISSAVVGIPMAYLTVAVPAGIYRALGGGNAGNVFA